MKTLFELKLKQLSHLRKRLAHKAIGPLLGALIAGLLLFVLMLHVVNGPSPEIQSNRDSHGFVRTTVSAIAWRDAET